MGVRMSGWGRKPVLFYGVNSEGMGHATRARPVIEALQQHYDVHVFCGGRARRFLMRFARRVHLIWWGRIIYKNNRAAVRTTVVRSFLQGPWVLLSGAYVTLLSLLLRPVAILSDFECLSAWAGMLTLRKVITLDNQQLIAHAQLPPPPPQDVRGMKVVRRVMFFNTPVVHQSLIMSFFRPPLRPGVPAQRARYVPVGVRPLVAAQKPHTHTDGPVLVYQTSSTNQDLPHTLTAAAAATGLRFVVYGSGMPPADEHLGVAYCAFNEEAFARHMAGAPFVIMNGGHSTICEALCLGKPVLAEPVADQYEQVVNAMGLQQMGVGRMTRKLTVQDVAGFLAALPQLRGAAAAVDVVDNAGLVTAVLQAVAESNPKRAAVLQPRPEGTGEPV